MQKVQKGHLIKNVSSGGIADEMGVEAGDFLLEVNGRPIGDVLDFHYQMNDGFVTVLIKKRDGEEWELEIEKESHEDFGVEFESGLMDNYRSCRNKCVFCFIDQMPRNMRETLYFKDDDARLSFLQGNYITLTNMNDEDMDKVVLYRLSPINISVHTTNKDLRCKMLNNRHAGEALDKIKTLYDAGIEMNSQVVLCKGYNDGEELDHTIADLSKYLPYMKSLSVVPVGLTKYREGLANLKPFRQKDALKTLDCIHKWQLILKDSHDKYFVHASDEWYIMANLALPGTERYEGFPQLENGVGMVRVFLDDFQAALHSFPGDDRSGRASIVTGQLFAPYLGQCMEGFQRKYPRMKPMVHTVVNRYFGEAVTVAGLLTGRDVIEQLGEVELGDRILLPSNMLRSGEDVFLDDITIKDLEYALQREVRVVKSDGMSLVNALLCKIDD